MGFARKGSAQCLRNRTCSTSTQTSIRPTSPAATAIRWCKRPTSTGLAADGAVFDNVYCASPICVPSRMSDAVRTLSRTRTRSGPTNTYWTRASRRSPTRLGAAGYRPVLVGRMHSLGPDQLHGYAERLVGDHSSNYIGGVGPDRGVLERYGRSPSHQPAQLRPRTVRLPGPRRIRHRRRRRLPEPHRRRPPVRRLGRSVQSDRRLHAATRAIRRSPRQTTTITLQRMTLPRKSAPSPDARPSPSALVARIRRNRRRDRRRDPARTRRLLGPGRRRRPHGGRDSGRAARKRAGREHAHHLHVRPRRHGRRARPLVEARLLRRIRAKVPLIISWPGVIPAGQRCDHVVSALDVNATILDALDAPALAQLARDAAS